MGVRCVVFNKHPDTTRITFLTISVNNQYPHNTSVALSDYRALLDYSLY